MDNHSSPSTLDSLLHEALTLEADDLYFKGQGESATLRFRVRGFVVEAFKRQIADFPDLVAQVKSRLNDEEIAPDEWSGQFSFLTDEGTFVIQVLWLREQGTEALALRILPLWLGLNDLGLNSSDALTLEELTTSSAGLVLGCGPLDGGQSTTLEALLEHLSKNKRRIVFSSDSPNPHLANITYINSTTEELAEQLEILSGHFDVFAFENLNNARTIRAAFDLAAEGHLVIGICSTPLLSSAVSRLLDIGISPDSLRSHFLGGWSQVLLERTGSQKNIGLFHCLSRAQVNHWVFESEWLAAKADDESQALWHDAEEKIAQGLITREDAGRQLNYHWQN